VEDMAAHYIREIQSVQTEGPYYLGGLSFGGAVAFEMAQQLHAQGQEVGLVALFDTFPTNYKPNSSLIIKFLLLPIRLKYFYLFRKMKNARRNLRRRISKAFLPRELKNVRKACREAAKSYVPTVYPGRVVLFRASDKSFKTFDDLLIGWNQWVLGGLETHEVAGDHLSIITEPQVSDLARQLKECLNTTRSADPTVQNTVVPSPSTLDLLLPESSSV
jgi:aspartate racemase